MLTKSWLDDFQSLLVARGLPLEYVRRISGELRDHAEDAGGEMSLGDPNLLAQATIHEYRTGYFAGRHPWLAFVGLPVVFVVLLASVYTVFADVSLIVLGWFLTRHDDPMMAFATTTVIHLMGYVTPIAGLWFCWSWHRFSGQHWGWYALLTAIIGLLATCVFACAVQATPSSLPEVTFELLPPRSVWQGSRSMVVVLVALVLQFRVNKFQPAI